MYKLKSLLCPYNIITYVEEDEVSHLVQQHTLSTLEIRFGNNPWNEQKTLTFIDEYMTARSAKTSKGKKICMLSLLVAQLLSLLLAQP